MISQKRTRVSHTTLNKKQQQAGFSLPEVLIVIAIIGILAAIAFPSFLHWLPNIRLKAAARDLYSNMQQAKIQAIKQNKDWAIVFDTTTDKYYVCSDPGTDVDWATVVGNAIEETVNLGDYKSGVTFGSGSSTPANTVTYTNNVAIFNPRGTGKLGYVYLDHAKNTDTIRVGTLISGVIMISRWKGSSWE